MKKPEPVRIHSRDSAQTDASELGPVFQVLRGERVGFGFMVQAVRDASDSSKGHWAPMHILVPGSQANGAVSSSHGEANEPDASMQKGANR